MNKKVGKKVDSVNNSQLFHYLFVEKYDIVLFNISQNGQGLFMRNFFGNLRYKIGMWMQGRYGNDEFNRFLSIVAIVCFILSFFGTLCTPLGYAYWLGLAILIYTIIRSLSKNIRVRSKERDFYVNIKSKIVGFFKLQVRRIKEGKTSKFYRCPKCRTIIRVPKGRGRIQITCPKCRQQFIKRT